MKFAMETYGFNIMPFLLCLAGVVLGQPPYSTWLMAHVHIDFQLPRWVIVAVLLMLLALI